MFEKLFAKYDGITEFKLSINNCTAEDTVYEATISSHGATLTYLTEREYYDLKSKSHKADRHIINSVSGKKIKAALEQLIKECDILKWDGFDGPNPPDVLDGSSMNFKAKHSDGRTVTAYGSNNFPANYNTFANGLNKILN